VNFRTGEGGGAHSEMFLEIWEFENLKFLEFGKIYPAIAGRKISVFENLELLGFLEFVTKNAQLAEISKNKKWGKHVYIPPPP
jgi:hypothetical protein